MQVTHLPAASAPCPPEPWRGGLARTQGRKTQSRRGKHSTARARGRPPDGGRPWGFNFPEGSDQVLGTELNKEALKSHPCRECKWCTAGSPAERRMIRKSRRAASEADSVPAGFGVKRWLRHCLPRRSESRGESEKEARWWICFSPRPRVGTGLAICKGAPEVNKGCGRSRMTGGCKLPEGSRDRVRATQV